MPAWPGFVSEPGWAADRGGGRGGSGRTEPPFTGSAPEHVPPAPLLHTLRYFWATLKNQNKKTLNSSSLLMTSACCWRTRAAKNLPGPLSTCHTSGLDRFIKTSPLKVKSKLLFSQLGSYFHIECKWIKLLLYFKIYRRSCSSAAPSLLAHINMLKLSWARKWREEFTVSFWGFIEFRINKNTHLPHREA